MEKLLAKIKERQDAMWLQRPDDVAKMVGRNYNTGKEFSCWAYCWGYLSNLSNELYMVYNIAKKEQGDLETHKMLCAARCEAYTASFIAAGHMDETAEILTESAEAFKTLTSFAELGKLCRTLQRYLMQLSFWVDMELPWAEVCEFIDKRWHEEDRAIVK